MTVDTCGKNVLPTFEPLFLYAMERYARPTLAAAALVVGRLIPVPRCANRPYLSLYYASNKTIAALCACDAREHTPAPGRCCRCLERSACVSAAENFRAATSSTTAWSNRAPVASPRPGMDGQHVLAREALQSHLARFLRGASGTSLISFVASPTLERCPIRTGRITSASPSVFISRGVSLSMSSSARIGRSMMIPRLFPMAVSFLCIAISQWEWCYQS